jgi:hypothetical protein
MGPNNATPRIIDITMVVLKFDGGDDGEGAVAIGVYGGGMRSIKDAIWSEQEETEIKKNEQIEIWNTVRTEH